MAQKIFNLDFIKKRIEDTKFPFWSLSLVEGFKNLSNVMSYYGNDFEETDSDDVKVEKSLNKLDSVVMSFPANCVFQIDIKASRQANGSGIVGPFQFVNFEEQKEDLKGVNIPAGYVPQTMLEGVEERIKKDFDNKLEAFKIETERKRQKEEFERRLQELDEREKQLKELEKGYNSGVAKTADVLVEAGKKILGYIMQTQQPSAAAAQPQPALGEVDEKAVAVDKLAEYIYNNCDINRVNEIFTNLKQSKDV